MPDRLAIDSTVLGNCKSGQALRRSGAQVGDAIFVTGELGSSAAGLQLLLNGERVNETIDDWRQRAMRTHLRPEPRVAFGQALGQSGLAHAMLDVSDGLTQDLRHICESSHVSARLFSETIPIAEGATLPLALAGGEDFELLFTAEPTSETLLQRLAAAGQLRITRIGEVIGLHPGSLLWLDDQPFQPAGFDHFAAV
jgi:thiamine-monophosphate kinase